jgi:hypothetical protein
MISKLPRFAPMLVIGATAFSVALGATIVAAFSQAAAGADTVVDAAVDLVCSNAGSLKWLIGALGMSVGCSAIVALTQTPDPTTVAGKLYKVLELLALVIGKAKQVAKPGLSAVAVTIALALSACQEPAAAPTTTPAPTVPGTAVSAPAPNATSTAIAAAWTAAQAGYNDWGGVVTSLVELADPSATGALTQANTTLKAFFSQPVPSDPTQLAQDWPAIDAALQTLAPLILQAISK